MLLIRLSQDLNIVLQTVIVVVLEGLHLPCWSPSGWAEISIKAETYSEKFPLLFLLSLSGGLQFCTKKKKRCSASERVSSAQRGKKALRGNALSPPTPPSPSVSEWAPPSPELSVRELFPRRMVPNKLNRFGLRSV